MSVTPEFIGQRYKDTNTGNIWIANSTTPGDWTLEVQKAISSVPVNLFGNIASMVAGTSNVTQFTNYATAALNGIAFEFDVSLETISYPNLQTIDPTNINYSELNIVDLTSLTSASFPLLTAIGYAITFDGLTLLQTLDLSSLITSTSLAFYDCVAITSLSFPSLVTCNIVDMSGNTNLATISLPNWIPTNNAFVFITGSALSASSVNHVLARCVAGVTFVAGNINLSGGTSAAPSGQGIIDKATLIGRGISVTTN